MNSWCWEPLEVFAVYNYQNNDDDQNGNELNSKEKNALIILNQPISKSNDAKFIRLWDRSKVRICVDGAANRLKQWCTMNGTDEQRDSSFVPDYICGDLDSVDEVIKLEYESKGSKSIRLYDQDATDFQKTLKFLAELCQVPPSIVFSLDKSPPPRSSSSSTSTTNKFSQIENIFVFCEFGGRIDHSLAIFSSLYDPCLTPTSSSSSSSKEEKRSCLNVYTVSSESITFLLRVGTNIIYLDSAKGSQGAKSDEAGLVGKYCGLFPMGRPAVVTTRGLKWNLNRQLLEFGKFISSSNEFCVEENKSGSIGIDDVFRDLNYDKKRRHVLIKTDQPLIWTMSINF